MSGTLTPIKPSAASIPMPEGLLCVSNFPAETGYAWNFIESLYAGIADGLAERGIRTWVAYPSVSSPPATLCGSAAEAVELPVRLGSVRCVRATLDFIRTHRIRVIYLTDRASWDPAYALLRCAGVRRVVVHDHTSGERTPPSGLKALAKRLRHRIPGTLADDVLAVSDYVGHRKTEVDLVPAGRVRRIWNSLVIPDTDPAAGARLRNTFGLSPERSVVVCACRATPEKGVQHLMRAFDYVAGLTTSTSRPVLLYMGDGPALPDLQELRDSLNARDNILIAGYRPDAADLLEGATLCAAPSIWQEAFGLSVLEPMARGVPVIASQVGGIPEIVTDGETGLLVAPGDEQALADAILRLLSDPAERRRMGENGRRRARDLFSRDREIRLLTDIFHVGFSRMCDGPTEADPKSMKLK